MTRSKTTTVREPAESKVPVEVQFDMSEKIMIIVTIRVNGSISMTYTTEHAASNYKEWLKAIKEIPNVIWDGEIVVYVENNAGGNPIVVALNYSRYKLAREMNDSFHELRSYMYDELLTDHEHDNYDEMHNDYLRKQCAWALK